jgi:small subunit ribosomal protein S17
MEKTIVVEVNTYKPHPKYLKRYRVTKKYYAHDPKNECQVGDMVTIIESRPFSKMKTWKLLEVV